MDAPLYLSVSAVIVVALPPTSFPSLHMCSRHPSMRLTELPRLMRPDGLVVCRYGLLDATPPHACERLSMEQRPPPSSAPDCDCSWRIRRPVACRSGGGLPSLLRGPVARRFGWAGAGRRGQSKGKRQKPGLETAPQACLAACSPRHLSFPSFPPLLGNPCLHL
jgi:hypothetical protein